MGEQFPSFIQVKGNLFALPALPSIDELFKQLLASPNLQVYTQEARLQATQVRLMQASIRLI